MASCSTAPGARWSSLHWANNLSAGERVAVHAGRLDDETRDIAAGKRGWLGIGFVRSTTFSVLPSAVRKFRESCLRSAPRSRRGAF